jgi:SAM-dependent methyltransferase
MTTDPQQLIRFVLPDDPSWESPDFWDSYYTQLLSLPEEDLSRKAFVYRVVTRLDRMLAYTSENWGWTCCSVLDAGCGISLLPYLLQYWGYRVTAIDSSQAAIDFLKDHAPAQEVLARCVEVLEPHPTAAGACFVRTELARTLPALQKRRAEGGSLELIRASWNAESLPAASYDLIYCLNGFRFGTETFIREALVSFQRLLRPGGLLFIHNIRTAPERGDVIMRLLTEAGFAALDRQHDATKKYGVAWWSRG